MCYLSRGAFGRGANTYSVTAPGVHMLRYDKGGDFLGGNTMNITYNPDSTRVAKWWLTRSP